MSNKIVPTIYRAVIDDVIAQMKPEFDSYGVDEAVLAELQRKWEEKVIKSNVADFEPPHSTTAPAPHTYPPHAIHMQQPTTQQYTAAHNPYAPPAVNPVHPNVKSEPVDNRYVLSQPPGMSHYSLPALPGPQIPARSASSQSVLSFPPNGTNGHSSPAAPTARPYVPPQGQPTNGGASSTSTTSAVPGAPKGRIPQVDGPSSSASDSPSPPPTSYAPRPSHPSLPQPSASQSTSQGDDEAINSDLDDSDTENEEDAEDGGTIPADIVFCTYDKVARVKNKWKCVLKDGMIHVNDKDYLFAKCTGEFEW